MTSIETREIPTNTGMLKAIDLLVTNNKFSDVHFVFGKTKQQRLPAHQLLLALRSSEFAELFYGETSVSTSPTSKKKKKAALREIEITDITASAFEVMLNYIYTENLEKLKPNNALDVLKAAKKYKVEGLENACIQMISKSVVDASSVCSILSNAIKLDDSKLIQSAMQFIEQNIDQLVKPKQPQQQQQQQQQSPNIENIQNNLLVDQPFNDLTLDALTLILQNDKLCLSKEIDLFNATHRWSIFQYQRQLDETIQQQQQQQQPFQLPSAEIKRKILGDRAIASIRYPLMTLEEIAQFVSPSGLLTDRQLVQLYDAFILNTPNLFNFPSKPRKPKEKTPPTPTDEKKDTKVETKKGNRLYVFGGHDGSTSLNTCEMYDPINNEWKSIAPMSSKRYGLATATYGNRLYVFGGYDGSAYLNTCEMYDPINNEWKSIAPMSSKRQNLAATTYGNRLYIFGGWITETCEMYDPINNEWKSIAPMSSKRGGLAATTYDGV